MSDGFSKVDKLVEELVNLGNRAAASNKLRVASECFYKAGKLALLQDELAAKVHATTLLPAGERWLYQDGHWFDEHGNLVRFPPPTLSHDS